MHSAVTTAPVNKAAVAAAFGRAAGQYDSVAHLQQKTGHHLRQLTTQALSGQIVSELHGLDAGCGTGFFSEQWKAECRSVTAFDLSPAMLAHAAGQQRATRYVQGDIEQLPFAESQFDFCFSNLAVQWCDSLAAALAGLVRVTRPGGVVAFSTLLSGSLDELNQAFSGWTAIVTPTVFSAGRPFLPPVSLTGTCCRKSVTGSLSTHCPRCCTPLRGSAPPMSIRGVLPG